VTNATTRELNGTGVASHKVQGGDALDASGSSWGFMWLYFSQEVLLISSKNA
jgi:hypothetical protein